jgi:hypothetical protein
MPSHALLNIMPIKKSNKSEQGSVLLYTILALAVMINLIIIISNLVVIELRQSANIDQAISAFYIAESGVEKALYEYRKKGTILPDGDCGLETGITCDLTTTQETMTGLSLVLQPNDSMQLNFNQAASQIESIEINWFNNGSWVEVSYVEWDPADLVWDFRSVNKFLLSGGSGIINDISSTKRYKIRIKASYDVVDAATVTFYTANNATGAPVPIPSSMTFTAQGEHGNSAQKVSASMPPEKSLLGLFDYVLFSEQAIIK